MRWLSGRFFPQGFVCRSFLGNVSLRCTRRFVSDRRGFGITGLLAALFFIAIFSAAVVPRLWGVWTSMKLEAEAAQLAAELMRFRETMMNRMPMHQDFVDAQTEASPIFELRTDGYRVLQSGKVLLDRQLPDGMALSHVGGLDIGAVYHGDVSFQMTGNASAMTIILQSGKETRYVIIDRVGRVRVSLTRPEE